MRGLNQREKRTVKFGVICAVAIIVFAFVTDILGRWKESRSKTGNINNQLKAISLTEAERARLMSIVPVFEMPEKEEVQKFLFRDKFNEQLKKAGIKS
jgi:hypothetical protein